MKTRDRPINLGQFDKDFTHNSTSHNNQKCARSGTHLNPGNRKRGRKKKIHENEMKRNSQKRQYLNKVLNEKVNHAKTFIKNISNVSLTNNEILVLSKYGTSLRTLMI